MGQALPVKQHPYRVNPVKLKAIRNECIVEPQWCILVSESDMSYRFCMDFRRLKGQILTSIPRIDDCIDRIGHTKYISKLDLRKGYWQVPPTKWVKEVSAFATPDGLYQYCVMPFGTKNAPATCGVIVELEGCEAYIDDVVVYSNTWYQHIIQLKALLSRLFDCKSFEK